MYAKWTVRNNRRESGIPEDTQVGVLRRYWNYSAIPRKIKKKRMEERVKEVAAKTISVC